RGRAVAPPRRQGAQGRPAMKLLVYNVNCRNADRAAAIDAIAAIDADLALLQEIAGEWPAELDARLAATYPHRIVHLADRAPGGLAVLSKLPIDDDRVIPAPPDGWFPAQRLLVGGVQILHVHL